MRRLVEGMVGDWERGAWCFLVLSYCLNQVILTQGFFQSLNAPLGQNLQRNALMSANGSS